MIFVQVLESFLQVQYLHVLASLSQLRPPTLVLQVPRSYFLRQQPPLQQILCEYIVTSAPMHCATKISPASL